MKILTAFLLAFTGILPAAVEKDWTAWQWEAPFDVGQAGVVRLEVPPAVLDVSRPDLGDVRLLSSDGKETGYLIDLSRHREGGVREATGFKVNLAGKSTVIEATSDTTDAIEAVQLVSPAREFLKSVSVEGRKGNGEWQPLATSEVIFRQSAGAERLRIPLSGGVWDGLRFTVNDDRSQPIPFTGVRVITASEKPATLESVVSVTGREELPNETRLTLDLGTRNLNVAELRFEIPDAVFSRTCTVSFATPLLGGGNRMETLASSVLYRVTGDRGISTEDLVVPINRRIPTRYLIATFRDDESTPLKVTGAKVRCNPTLLTFFAVAGPSRLLTGNRYSLPRPYLFGKPTREALIAAGGQDLLPGTLRANPNFQAPPVLPGIDPIGAGIDLASWTRRRRVVVDAAPSMAIQIELDAWVMAGCSRGLGDLRLVQNGLQIPYVMTDPVVRELTPSMISLPNDPKRPTILRWELTLPMEGLPALELAASSPAPLFARRFEASIERKDELGNRWTESLGTTEWAKSPDHDTQLVLPLKLGGQRMPRKLQLQTDNGDNPPISLENPKVRFTTLWIIAKVTDSGPLYLVYGNPKATTPQYDLRLVDEELKAAEPQPASLREEEILGPDKREKMSVDAGSPWLWLALAGVVAALLVVVAKLVPRPATE